MQVVKKVSVYRLTDKMTLAHTVVSSAGEILVEEDTVVTKEIKDKLIRNFIEEVYVHTEMRVLRMD